MKVVVGSTDDQRLVFGMIWAEAGEVMAVMQTAVLAELPYMRVRDCFAHLTIAEGIWPPIREPAGAIAPVTLDSNEALRW